MCATIQRLFETGRINEAYVDQAVVLNWITQEQADAIKAHEPEACAAGAI